MALWQFDLSFTEVGASMPLLTADGHRAPPLSLEKVELAREWLESRIGMPHEFFADWLVFGENEGNRVDLLTEGEGGAGLSARIDARSDPSNFVAVLCELCELLGCVFFSAQFWRHIEPTAAAVGWALERSRAAAFVHDPVQVLRGPGGVA